MNVGRFPSVRRLAVTVAAVAIALPGCGRHAAQAPAAIHPSPPVSAPASPDGPQSATSTDATLGRVDDELAQLQDELSEAQAGLSTPEKDPAG